MKSKIVKTAGEMFFKYGVKSVSIDDICNEIHISKKTFYVYFKRKDDLIVDLLVKMREQKERDQKEMLECDNMIDFFLKNSKKFTQPGMMDKYTALFYDLEKYYPEIYSDYKERTGERSEVMTKLMLQRGIKQGWFRDDMDLDMMACLIARGFNVVVSTLPKQRGSMNRASFFVDAFLRMVVSPRGLEYYLQHAAAESKN